MTFEDTLRNRDPQAELGLGLVAASTLLAVLLIPQDFSVPGALAPSAIVQTLGLLAPIALEVVRRPKAILRSDYLLLIGLAYWILLDLIQGQQQPERVSGDAVRFGFIAIGVFACGIWSAALFPPWQAPRVVREAGRASLSSQTLTGALVACFVLGMAHYVLSCNFDFGLLISSLGAARFGAPWSSGALGGWDAFSSHLVFFGYLVPVLTVLIAERKGWRAGVTVAGCAMSLCILAYASQSGTRNEVGVIAGAALLCWLLQRPRITARMWLQFAIAVVVLLAWLQVMLVVRNDGMWQLFEASTSERLAQVDAIMVDDNFNRLCQVGDLIPDRVGHTYGGQLFYVLVRPIPRVFWPGKPVGPGFSFEEAVAVEGVTATWSVTAVAEFYYDFGFPFVFLGGFLFGRMAGAWNQLLTMRGCQIAPLLYGLGAMALFVGIRSQQAFIVRVYPILFWLVLYNVFLGGKRPTLATPPGAVAARPPGKG